MRSLQLLPPARQRLLAGALLLLALIALDLFLVQPYLELYGRLQTSIQALLTQRGELIDRIAQSGYWQQQASSLRARLGSEPPYFEGETPAVAAAALQEKLRHLVEESGGEIRSIQTLPLLAEGQLKRIGVSLRLQLKTRSLHRLLYRIETASPLLIVEQLDVAPGRGYYDRRSRRYRPLDRLQVTLQVTAFFRERQR